MSRPAMATPSGSERVRDAHRVAVGGECRMLTDPVYEGKSMAALGSRALYAHLGGQPALNAYAGVF
jgi:1-aminocyclopropane-1-carboxylate deaminase